MVIKKTSLVRCLGLVLGCLLLGADNGQAQSSLRPDDVRGVLRPAGKASISTDLLVPIKSLPFKQGQRFKQNDLLLAFDCAKYEAERGSLLAEYKVRKLTVENNQTLFGHQAMGEFDLNISRAEAERAEAGVKLLDARLAGCKVNAPFDGFVSELFVHRYETPTASTPIMTIIDDSDIEIELIVPSNWLRWLAKDVSFMFSVDETGKHYSGKITRLNPAVDPISQTIKIFGKFDSQATDAQPGMSGTAQFNHTQG